MSVRRTRAKAGAVFAAQRPRAVVTEGESLDKQDQNAIGFAALTSLQEQDREQAPPPPEERRADTLVVRTGNALVDQFQPRYFAIAFAFCFKYGTACPDVFNTTALEQQRSRRRERDPRSPMVSIHEWAAGMGRRVEAQFRRDWNFGFVLQNYLFRTMVNLQGSAYLYSAGGKKMTGEEIEEGSRQLRGMLEHGKYTDITGAKKPVNRDFSKLRYADGLPPAAKKIVENSIAKCRNIPGTHEVRNSMRQQTHAYRVCYGTPIFLTFSPSERDSTIMLRMARTREADPALAHDQSRDFQTRSRPELDVDYLQLDPEVLLRALPDYDQRRAMLARDPLACAEGFWALVQLALRHLFGVRWCPNCPHCAKSKTPCTDAFGSSATAMGGILGRVDAAFGSIECQKSGTLHVHFQIFLQCFHQFTPLTELVHMAKDAYQDLVQKYKDYTTHVRRTVYCSPSTWQRERALVEAAWPEYRDSLLMLSRPAYQSNAEMPAADWRERYLEADVEELQKHKQHHVHLAKTPGGPRLPLNHCQDRKDPTKCKAGFPRNKQLTEETVLVCEGLARQMDMPAKGKRSMLGSLWGPVNDPDLNGTHPALLAALRCNSDVQLPYRFPINADTHSAACEDKKCPGGNQPVRALVREAQRNQSAQAGYACDYGNKRGPIAVHEIREWNKGNNDMAEELKGKPAGYIGSRNESRFITDCFCRGMCRGSTECVNLITRHQRQDVLDAESVRTAPTIALKVSYGIELLQAALDEQPWPVEPVRWSTEARAQKQRKVVSHCPFWTLYGSRGNDPRVHQLSAFEFARHYEFKRATHPWSVAQQEAEENTGKYEALLTEAGMEKVRWHGARAKLSPGIDYRVREPAVTEQWIPFGASEKADPFRHDWVMVPRERPYVPVLLGAEGSKTDEEQAMKILLLFRPWVNDRRLALEDYVPFVSNIRDPGATGWRHALQLWLTREGFPTESVKRYATQFCFVHCLPRELQSSADFEPNSDNEDVEDVPCHFDEAWKGCLKH